MNLDLQFTLTQNENFTLFIIGFTKHEKTYTNTSQSRKWNSIVCKIV